ncbi:nitrous oxide reductase family maturation protein NosD [Haloferax sp. DFSO60]|uniref:right-handed parallel beta-helix repeat-containing protein n=1 Tax=Haloferax sp. DFSO60 TaxID=3388652 RepID=UPI00397D6B88
MSEEHSPESRRLSRREILRKSAVATTVAGLGLSGSAGSAAATEKEDAVPIDGPTLITEPGYYVLTQDIILGDEPGAISVEEEVGDVTIDGRGYTLDGTGKADVGIFAGEAFRGNENITVKNLCVTGFTQSGIRLGSNTGSAVKNVTFTDCEAGLRWISVSETVVKDCTFKNNSTGVFTTEGGTDDVFLRNHFVSNDTAAYFDNINPGFLFKENRVEHNDGGVIVSDFVSGTSIVGNEFYRNGFGAIIESATEGVIKGNQFVENEGDGIDLRGARDFSIEKNHVLRNSGVGINLISVVNSTVSKNLVRGNAADGIFFWGVTNSEVVKNKVLNNGGDGIGLRDSDDNVIRKNVIKGNGGLPIRIDDESTGNIIEKNKTDEKNGGGNGGDSDDKEDGNGDICRIE